MAVRRVCNDCDEKMRDDNSCGCGLPEALTKTTTFTGRTSEDHDGFFFDKRTTDQEERDEVFAPGSGVDARMAARVYPDDLIPEGVGDRMGRWTITITFEAIDDA